LEIVRQTVHGAVTCDVPRNQPSEKFKARA
jgi:hypothetical protein